MSSFVRIKIPVTIYIEGSVEIDREVLLDIPIPSLAPPPAEDELPEETYQLVKELVEELNTSYSHHRELAVRAMRYMRVSDVDIEGWFKGNIIL